MDGYRVARVVPLKDEVVEEGSDEAERVRQLVKARGLQGPEPALDTFAR